MSHGYLPLGKAYYRKHLTIPASSKDDVMYLEFDGTQSANVVYLNGYFVGAHNSGYTPSRYFLNSSIINFGAENLLAVFVDVRGAVLPTYPHPSLLLTHAPSRIYRTRMCNARAGHKPRRLVVFV